MLVHRGTVGIIDFDDSRWCFPIQDMGISVHALLRRPEGERLTDAFLRGYRSVRPLPEHVARLHLFIAARLVDLIGLYLPDPHRQDVAARLLDDAERWLPGVLAGETPFCWSGLCTDTGGAARVRPSQGGHA